MLRLNRYNSFILGCLIYFILLMVIVICCSCCSGSLLPQAQHPDTVPHTANKFDGFS